jgi:hypothetical protein
VEDRLDLDLDSLRPGLVVADVIPNPPRTQLIRDAEARGCVVLDGLGMLVSQGAIGIRYWTGIEPELQVMRRELEHIFGVKHWIEQDGIVSNIYSGRTGWRPCPQKPNFFVPRPGQKPRTAFLATLGEIITTAAA